MLTNKDIRVAEGNIVINGDKYPLDGQSPETIMQIVKDNSDTTPTENSDAPITSGGVFTALADKEDTLTFDTAPTDASTNPVTSGGVYIAIDAVSDDVEEVSSGIFDIVTNNITATTEDDFLAQVFANIKADSNLHNNASITRNYVWSTHDSYFVHGARVSGRWIYAFVYSYDRSYIIAYDCNSDIITTKKIVTLT